ncbi:Codeine O-demethylase [Glycine soja]|nr:Codeine O-demethylase [Glycine soja]
MMAESGEEEIVGKPVQELLLNPENLPKNYIYEEGGAGFRDALVPSQDDDIPVIDLHRLSSSSISQQELAKLHHALHSWGCFQAINHGMKSSFLDKVREVSKQFFQLPKEEKQKCAREREPNNIEGYGNDVIYSKNQRLDWTDRVYLKVLPEDERKFNFWPQTPNDFRSTVLQYTESLRLLSEVILKAMAKSLNLEEDCFLNECGERSNMIVRVNYYPPCPMPDHVLGVKPHADGSTITFLLQDKEVEGLQVLKDDQWFKVPIIPDALLINVGDQIEIMSNGIFRSPVHRVVINKAKERLTVAMFCVPDSEKEIKPVDKLVNESRPVLYRPEGGAGFRDALVPSQDENIPVIDLHRLSSPSTALQELAKLHHALHSWGCFQAINHGLKSSFLDKVREVSKQFFHLPKEEKQKWAREPNNIEGYGNDIIYSENQRLDWTDRVYLKVLPEDERKFKFWPQNPYDFRSIVLQYTESMRLLSEVIIKAMAKSLNLEEDCFLNECGERADMFLRFNYYPPCPMPDHVLGVKPHADGSTITFLLQDKEVEGLQVLKDDQWFKVPIIPDALVINVGDQIEIMSNGIFRSPIHRAVINSEKERLTVAMFCLTDSEKEIKPVEKLVNESRPTLYRPVKNYSEIYFQYYQQGKRPIEASKI